MMGWGGVGSVYRADLNAGEFLPRQKWIRKRVYQSGRKFMAYEQVFHLYKKTEPDYTAASSEAGQ